MSAPIPSPAIFANRKAPVEPPRPAAKIIAVVEPQDPGKRVTLGTRDDVVSEISDGVVKTKHLTYGQRVQPFVNGVPRGSVRIVGKVTKVDDGAMWLVEWASAHVAQEFKAAYRWYDADLDGAEVQHLVKVPAFVPAFD